MFTDKENWEISKLLAAILHMGNLRYDGEVNGKERFSIYDSPCEARLEMYQTEVFERL